MKVKKFHSDNIFVNKNKTEDMFCPLLKRICKKRECAWFCGDRDRCSIQELGIFIYGIYCNTHNFDILED